MDVEYSTYRDACQDEEGRVALEEPTGVAGE